MPTAPRGFPEFRTRSQPPPMNADRTDPTRLFTAAHDRRAVFLLLLSAGFSLAMMIFVAGFLGGAF